MACALRSLCLKGVEERKKGGEKRNDKGNDNNNHQEHILRISFPARDKGNYSVCPGFEGIASTKGSGPRLASITAILIPPHGRNLSFSVQIAALPIAFA